MESQKFVITINREFGSGGGEVARKLADLLGVKVYDKKILSTLTEKYDLTIEEMERIKSKKLNWWSEFCRFYSQYMSVAQFANTSVFPSFNREITSLELYYSEAKILHELAEKESCVIIGRTGFHIFKDDPAAIRILFIANMDYRIQRVMKKYGVDQKTAIERIEALDESRENFTKTFAGVSRYDARNYDFVINISNLSTDGVAKFLAHNIRLKYPEQ